MHWSPDVVATVTAGQFWFYRAALERQMGHSQDGAAPAYATKSDEENDAQAQQMTAAIGRLSALHPDRDGRFDVFGEVMPEIERYEASGASS